MTVRLLTEPDFRFLNLKEAAQIRLNLQLSKNTCHGSNKRTVHAIGMHLVPLSRMRTCIVSGSSMHPQAYTS